VKNIPAISRDLRKERTDVSERTDDGEIVWRGLYFRFDIVTQKSSPFRDNLVVVVSGHRSFMRRSFVVVVVASNMVIALSLEPGHLMI
jgi:hypothetical protein